MRETGAGETKGPGGFYKGMDGMDGGWVNDKFLRVTVTCVERRGAITGNEKNEGSVGSH